MRVHGLGGPLHRSPLRPGPYHRFRKIFEFVKPAGRGRISPCDDSGTGSTRRNAMIQVFEAIMTGILAYMAYAIFEGSASSAVLGVLILIQAFFWGLDFLFVRGGME